MDFSSLKVPIMVAPMFLVSGIDLVVASMKAGVLGTFPASNARSPEMLEAWLSEISAIASDLKKERGQAPLWAVNLVTHRSNNALEPALEMVQEFKPPIVITALGGPGPVADAVHSYGGQVYADVNSISYAKKALDKGADGLVLVAAGAGGHTGTIAGLSFISEIRDFFGGPVALGGGISDGAGVSAVVAAGADLANMGTAFIPTIESLASDRYREILIEATIDDLVLSDAITGVKAYWLRKSLIEAGIDPDLLQKDFKIDFSRGKAGEETSRETAERRDRWTQIWSAGHGVGKIKKVEPVAELVERLTRDYMQAHVAQFRKPA